MKKEELLRMDPEAFKQLIESAGQLKRYRIARMGVGLDYFMNDASPSVREKVAEQGYGLDKLYYDFDVGVREEAFAYLMRMGLTLDMWIKENPDKCALPENRNPEANLPRTPQALPVRLVKFQAKLLEANHKGREKMRSFFLRKKKVDPFHAAAFNGVASEITPHGGTMQQNGCLADLIDEAETRPKQPTLNEKFREVGRNGGLDGVGVKVPGDDRDR